MTANQIAYFRAQEDKRHNIVSEALDKYRTDINYQSSIYGSDRSYASSIYSSDKHLEGTKYAADQSRAASQYSADRHLEGTIYSANQSRLASQYAADQSRAASQYAADRSYQANVRRAELSLEGTQYQADKSFKASVFTNASKERIAEEDRKVDKTKFNADYELRKFIADADVTAKQAAAARDYSQVFNNASSAMKNFMSALSSGVSIAGLFM